eukprot:414678_1
MTLENTINFTESSVISTIDITGDCVRKQSKKCRTLSKKVKQELSILLGINQNTMEIIKPTHIKNGFSLKFYIYSNDKYSKQIDYNHVLLEANKNEDLATIIEEGC